MCRADRLASRSPSRATGSPNHWSSITTTTRSTSSTTYWFRECTRVRRSPLRPTELSGVDQRAGIELTVCSHSLATESVIGLRRTNTRLPSYSAVIVHFVTIFEYTSTRLSLWPKRSRACSAASSCSLSRASESFIWFGRQQPVRKCLQFSIIFEHDGTTTTTITTNTSTTNTAPTIIEPRSL